MLRNRVLFKLWFQFVMAQMEEGQRWKRLWPSFLTIQKHGHDGWRRLQMSAYVTKRRVAIVLLRLSPSLYSNSLEGIINYAQRREDTKPDRKCQPGYQEQRKNFGLKPISLFFPFPPVPWALMTDGTMLLKGVSGENTPAQQLSTYRETGWQYTDYSCSVAELAKCRQRHC